MPNDYHAGHLHLSYKIRRQLWANTWLAPDRCYSIKGLSEKKNELVKYNKNLRSMEELSIRELELSFSRNTTRMYRIAEIYLRRVCFLIISYSHLMEIIFISIKRPLYSIPIRNTSVHHTTCPFVCLMLMTLMSRHIRTDTTPITHTAVPAIIKRCWTSP